jgi:hypothetical protein
LAEQYRNFGEQIQCHGHFFISVESDGIGRPCSALTTRGGRASEAAAQIERRVDQADMRKRLGEIPKQSAAGGIVCLGEQADVVADCEQSLKSQFETASADFRWSEN